MPDPDQSPVAAALEHLTGKSRGTYSWITTGDTSAFLDDGGRIAVHPGGTPPPAGEVPVARFRRTGRSFEIDTAGDAQIWVNRQPVTRTLLAHGDMVEFGETGPLSRFRLYDDNTRPALTLGEIAGDTLSYLRTSRRPLHRRLAFAVTDFGRRLFADTTLLFRAGVLLALVLLTASVALQYRAGKRIEADLADRSQRVDALAEALTQTRREAIRPGDLAALGTEMRAQLSDTAGRLETLEARRDATRRVITNAAPSVVFLQGGYGLQDRETGRRLRHVTDADGVPVLLPDGKSLLSLDGDGPVAEVQFNGTGFLVRGAGRDVLITNRHVAIPWSDDAEDAGKSDGSGMEPVMIRFIAYFPGHADPVPVTLLAASDSVDLAVLLPDTTPGRDAALAIAAAAPVPGDEVVVMGYPTGLMSLLAQSGADFVEDLRKEGKTGFWEVAEGLAAAGMISPLSSRGIVGRAGDRTVVYDAETTHGGSGGPVLNTSGEVVAVNTAILPEFGGSNLGVPAAQITALLAAIRAEQ